MLRMLLVSVCVILCGCADEPPAESGAPADTAAAPPDSPPGTGSTADAAAGGAGAETYECRDLRFTVRIDQAMAFLELPDRTLQLPASSTSNGTRYTDGQSTFWEDNGRASLELPEASYYDCEKALPADTMPVDTMQT